VHNLQEEAEERTRHPVAAPEAVVVAAAWHLHPRAAAAAASHLHPKAEEAEEAA
jgi:hypothetical protein